MGMPWTRIGDITTPCPLLCAPGCIHGPETNVQGNPTVIVEGMPGCAVGHIAVGCGPPAPYAMGSPTVMNGGSPTARIGDPTAHGSMGATGAAKTIVGP